MLKLNFLFVICLLTNYASFAQDADEIVNFKSYREQCLEVAAYLNKKYVVDCHYNYHHFNSEVQGNYSVKKAKEKGNVKIAEFNVLHPGSSKTRYKDYGIVANIINQWDVVAVTELLPLVSADLKHNNSLVKFIQESPSTLKKLEMDLSMEQAKPKKNLAKIKSIELSIQTLTDDMKKASSLYREPGYMKILEALHSLPNGAEWSLILSPRGEAAKKTDVHEMVGYFYRSSTVKPVINEFCKKIKTLNHGNPYGCLVPMTKGFMGKDYRPVFSRRPFMSSFQSGSYNFTLLASHVVFNSPTDPKQMNTIMKLAFNKKDPKELSTGINSGNYARFAEVKVTLDFMQMLRDKLKMTNIIFTGDMNLETKNPFWEQVLRSFVDGHLYSDEPSSVSEIKFNSKGEATNGLASDYDHFIFSKKETPNCLKKNGELNGGVDNFYKGKIGALVQKKYLVRIDAPVGPYKADDKKYFDLEEEFLEGYLSGTKTEETIGNKTVTSGDVTAKLKGIVKDEALVEDYVSEFRDRVLDSQLKDDSYYSIYKQVISDHLPIYMSCSNI